MILGSYYYICMGTASPSAQPGSTSILFPLWKQVTTTNMQVSTVRTYSSTEEEIDWHQEQDNWVRKVVEKQLEAEEITAHTHTSTQHNLITSRCLCCGRQMLRQQYIAFTSHNKFVSRPRQMRQTASRFSKETNRSLSLPPVLWPFINLRSLSNTFPILSLAFIWA